MRVRTLAQPAHLLAPVRVELSDTDPHHAALAAGLSNLTALTSAGLDHLHADGAAIPTGSEETLPGPVVPRLQSAPEAQHPQRTTPEGAR